jgi:hypothetical protein
VRVADLGAEDGVDFEPGVHEGPHTLRRWSGRSPLLKLGVRLAVTQQLVDDGHAFEIDRRGSTTQLVELRAGLDAAPRLSRERGGELSADFA